jgi:hypothetical protein
MNRNHIRSLLVKGQKSPGVDVVSDKREIPGARIDRLGDRRCGHCG